MKPAYLVLGFFALALGAVGAAIPILPTAPFLLLASFCFARSSDRLHTWFVHTRLYRDNLRQFVEERGMTRRTKCRVFLTVSAAMTVGWILMRNTQTGRLILLAVWLIHALAIFFGVRTLPASFPANESGQKGRTDEKAPPGEKISTLCDQVTEGIGKMGYDKTIK